MRFGQTWNKAKPLLGRGWWDGEWLRCVATDKGGTKIGATCVVMSAQPAFGGKRGRNRKCWVNELVAEEDERWQADLEEQDFEGAQKKGANRKSQKMWVSALVTEEDQRRWTDLEEEDFWGRTKKGANTRMSWWDDRRRFSNLDRKKRNDIPQGEGLTKRFVLNKGLTKRCVLNGFNT